MSKEGVPLSCDLSHAFDVTYLPSPVNRQIKNTNRQNENITFPQLRNKNIENGTNF